MRFFSLILLLALLAPLQQGHTQEYVLKADFDRRSAKLFEAARAAINIQDLRAARAALNDLLDREPQAIDALLLRAGVAYEARQYLNAETDYEAALKLGPNYRTLTHYQLARTKMRLEKFDEAIPELESFLGKAKANDRRRPRAETFLIEAKEAAALRSIPIPFEPVSLGATINTLGKEYLPSFTADGRFLIYTVNYDGQEDFYVSEMDENGQWIEGQALEAINTAENEGAQSISADGQTLVFTGCHRRDGMGSCDLYITEKRNEEWESPQQVGEPLNTRAWESQPSLSSNGQQLLFSSERPGGLGGRDLWLAEKLADGSWGNIRNLGAPINTKGDDESPFLHADGQTLYFMSDGHGGLGGSDLFVTRLDSVGKWGIPKNLGYPINTVADEGALVVSLDGQKAYYTTDQNTQPGKRLDLDIYQFDLYDAIRPQPVTYLEAIVTDARTGKPLNNVTTILFQEDTGLSRTQVGTDANGRFLAVLPSSHIYQIRIEQEGYLFYSERIELTNGYTPEKPYAIEVALQPIEASPIATKPVVLRNVLFATGTATLLPASTTELARLVQLLTTNSDLNIQLNGHTDNTGSPATNQTLSEERAKVVYEYLIEQGIDSVRLRYQGFGETVPIASNDTLEGRAQNRRTEFEIW